MSAIIDGAAPTSADAITKICLLYTSDAADERSSVDLGGRRIIKKKKIEEVGDDRRRINRNNKYHRPELVSKKAKR